VEGVDLTLLRPAENSPLPAGDPISKFTPLLDSVADDGWKPLDAPKPPHSLADIFGEQDGSQAQMAQAQAERKSDSHVKVEGRTSQTMNDLWKAIEPCWKRVADKSTVSVTLNVSFSPLGNLSKPPAIIREPNAGISDARVRSETLAIRALSECGPYLMAFGQSDLRILFPAKP
jgi:hypothetical protein